MLYRNLLLAELTGRRDSFVRFDRTWRDELRSYARRLRLLDAQSVAAGTQLASRMPGALPSRELEAAGSIVVSFGRRWRTHEEARRWAIEILQDRVTFAADGSQLLPGREVSLPVAAVQVASFENPHAREGKYRKEARVAIVTPAELLEGNDGRINAETIVTLRRFNLEMETLCDFMERQRGWRARGERPPVAFFDGSLTYLISFRLPRTRIQDEYAETIVRLIELSRETEVPVIGFIDQSYARDLISLLDVLDEDRECEPSLTLYDSQLLRVQIDDRPPVLRAWGDRTCFCYYLRAGMRPGLIGANGRSLLGFTYLQTTGDGTPARLDLPAWIYEAGLLDDCLDAVRAECVGGLGYPYAIETADAAAVITARDREQFLRAVQDFTEREHLAFSVSRKAASKVRRR